MKNKIIIEFLSKNQKNIKTIIKSKYNLNKIKNLIR